MFTSRDTDYEHYVKCGKCGWEGWAALMRHGYQGYGNVGRGMEDVEAMDFCPVCDTSEESAEAFLTCTRQCEGCQDRFLCWTLLKHIPVLADYEQFNMRNSISLVR